MKRSLKRAFSFWTAVLMMLNIVLPTGALADVGNPSAEFQSTLPTAMPAGALTPAGILGPGVEYGVIADTYTQKNHTETNFAVYTYNQVDGNSIEIIGSGANPIPFKIANIANQFTNGEQTKVDFDVYVNRTQTGKIHHNDAKTHKKTNIIEMGAEEIKKEVNELLAYGVNSSNLMKQYVGNNATVKPTSAHINGKTLDLTSDSLIPKQGTIYIDATNLGNIVNQTGWEVIKYEGQTLVFNFPQTSGITINKFIVTVKDPDGSIKEFPGNGEGGHENSTTKITSTTGEKDTTPTHNKYVDQQILRKFVFNAYNTGSLTLNSAAGVFLAPNANVSQPAGAGAGAGWIVTKKNFNSEAEWHFYFHDRHYSAYKSTRVNVAKTFKNQDGTDLPPDQKNKAFTFKMDEVDPNNNYQIKTGDNTYHQTVTGKAGNTIEFPGFGISNTDFPYNDQNGQIIGDNYIDRYYVIQEVPDSDTTIVNDSKKIYVHLSAHGYNPDKIDLSIRTSEDHENWSEAKTGERINVGTFNNYKKQNTSVEVEKKWRKAVYNGDDVTYQDTTGTHTADSVEVKLIAVKSLLQQGHGTTAQPTATPTATPTNQPTSSGSNTATPTPTPTPTPSPTPTPTPVPTFTLKFKSSSDNLSVTYRYKGGTTVQFWFDNGNQWYNPYENIRLSGDASGTIGKSGKRFSVNMNSDKTITLTDTSNSNWGNVVTNSLHLDPAPNGNSSSIQDPATKQRRLALDYQYFIASSGVSDTDYTSASSIGTIQSGLQSISAIIGDQEYFVVDTQTLSKANNWKYKWEPLPKHLYEEDGSIYTLTYYVVETSAIGAASNTYQDNGKKKVIIINTEAETSATVRKVWNDADNQDGIQPAKVTVDLMNGTTIVKTVELKASNNWTQTVEHLPKYNNGQKITYTWNEKNIPSGYTLSSAVSDDGLVTTLTNTPDNPDQ